MCLDHRGADGIKPFGLRRRRDVPAHQVERILEQNAGRVLFFALDAAARRIGRGVVDAGELRARLLAQAE